MTQDRYTFPYIPNTDEDRDAMIQAIGAESVEQLLRDITGTAGDTLPSLLPRLSEIELQRDFRNLASRNRDVVQYPSFLGGGAYHHFIPAAVRAITGRGELATAYTPYQPEVSQGTLQIIYEFQSLVCQLMEMEVANAGMYDGSTAIAEAALMACRITGKTRIAILNSMSPRHIDVLRTYTEPQGIEVYTVDPKSVSIDDLTACLIAQTPNYFGYVEPMDTIENIVHSHNALLVISTDPTYLGMFKTPGALGADIAVSEGQPLGIPLSFGGPYIGLFTCKTQFLRQMPGRIVGKTSDTQGKDGYVLTLQTREQHIRRERATSNICTSEALVGTAVVAYLACMGPKGLRSAAELTYQKSHYAAKLISDIPGYSIPMKGTFFQEFVVECPISTKETLSQLHRDNIIGGLDISDSVHNGMLVCVTEMNTREDIDSLVESLSKISPTENEDNSV